MDLLEKLLSEFRDAVLSRAASESDAIDGVQPQAAAAPRDEASAQALVHWCGRQNVAFVPRGGGTKLHIGAPPSRCDLVISTENLTQIFDYDEGNATVQAGAGISLEILDKQMRECGQFVPLAKHPTGGATLGGVIATNHFDSTKWKYGAPRDLVTGLHAVFSDGRLVKAGSKVVKNVSGYDLNKLVIGSFGTLGLITEVTIRLRPEPAQKAFWVKNFDSWDEAVWQAWEIVNGAFEPTALTVTGSQSGFAVYAYFEGGQEAIQSQLLRLPASSEDKPNSEVFDAYQWTLRAHLPLQAAPQWARLAQDEGAFTSWYGALGVVKAYFNAMPDIPVLRAEAEKLGGFLIVEKAPPKMKTPDLVWGKPRGDFALMKKLKQQFDAANVCAPGRFIGGL